VSILVKPLAESDIVGRERGEVHGPRHLAAGASKQREDKRTNGRPLKHRQQIELAIPLHHRSSSPSVIFNAT
jgi:hypothetical protein